MKLSYVVPKLAIIGVSLVLGVVVLTAVLPLTAGGLTVEETSPDSGLTMEEEGINMRITGDYTVRSSLPYDINDAYVKIRLGKADGDTMMLYDSENFDVPKGGDTAISIDQKVFLPTILIMAMVDYETGKLSVPATIFVGGSYLQKMTSVGVEVNVLINVSSDFNPDTFVKDVTPTDDGDYSHFDITVNAPGISMPADGSTIEAKIGDTTIKLTRLGDSITLTGDTDGAGILDDIRNATSVEVTDPPSGPVEVTGDQMETLANVLSKLLGAGL